MDVIQFKPFNFLSIKLASTDLVKFTFCNSWNFLPSLNLKWYFTVKEKLIKQIKRIICLEYFILFSFNWKCKNEDRTGIKNNINN